MSSEVLWRLKRGFNTHSSLLRLLGKWWSSQVREKEGLGCKSPETLSLVPKLSKHLVYYPDCAGMRVKNSHQKKKGKKASQETEALEEVMALQRFFIRTFFYCSYVSFITLCPLPPYKAHPYTRVCAHSRWWRMMVEAGTEPVSDLSCNRGNRAPIDPLGERPVV